jgi:xylono-1,5-lactonase
LALIGSEVPQVSVAARPDTVLGEGPVWDDRRQCLWFVDIKRPRLLRLDPASDALSQWPAPAEIGWALPAEQGGLVCGLADGLYRFDPDSGLFDVWQRVPGEPPHNRLNDATCDALGRIWFGSMDNDEQADSGRFYCLNSGAITALDFGPVCITNGPALSPDGRTIYLTDTLGRRIWRAPVEDDGSVGPAVLFVEFGDEAGYPDGPVVDSAGNVWTGMFAGWGVRCFDPAGRPLAFVRMPTASITKIAFGGPDLRTVYATSATKGLETAARIDQPLAGSLFSFRTAIAGQAGGVATI